MALNHSPDRFVFLPFRAGVKDTPDWMLCWRYAASNHPSNCNPSMEEVFKTMKNKHNEIVKTCSLTDTKNSPNGHFIDHTLRRYCETLGMAQAHFPLFGGKVDNSMHFVWYDSFAQSSKYDSLNSNNELVSCIYNLAASHNYAAATEAQSGVVEGIKSAFKDFQNAAGYYQMVESLLERVPTDQLTKGDMNRDSLSFLVRVCLAQTHHCGYLKAEDSMKGKHEMLSKIAMEAARQYDEVHVMMRATTWYTTKGTNAKDVEAQLKTLAVVFRTRAHLHLAVMSEEDSDMGVALAYYERAKDCLGSLPSQRTQPMTIWVNSVVGAVNAAHDKAIKMNASVYYARVASNVPEPMALQRSLGQAAQHTSFVEFESKRGSDPFFGIVPAHIAKVALQWRNKQREIVRACESAASTCRRNTQNKLQQLGVSTAIQTLSGEVQSLGRVPEPLRSNIMKLRVDSRGQTMSTTAVLTEAISACDQLYQVAKDKLEEITKELAKEKAKDATFMETYGEKMWRAVFPQSEQTPDYNIIVSAKSDHESGLQQWLVTPFSSARASLQENVNEISRLDWPIEDLDALMPFVETKEARQQSDKVMQLVAKLKDIVNQKEKIECEQAERQKELQRLIESDVVVFSLSSVDANQRDAVLTKATQDIVVAAERVNEKTREENALVTQADETMARLAELQSADPVTIEIQKVSNSLESACSIYTELRTELNNISTYASKAVESIDSTLSDAKTFTVSRELQAQDVQSRLDGQIAAKMAEMQVNENALEESRRRQEDLRMQIASIQQNVADRPPSYDSAMRISPGAPAAYSAPPPPPGTTGAYQVPAYSYPPQVDSYQTPPYQASQPSNVTYGQPSYLPPPL